MKYVITFLASITLQSVYGQTTFHGNIARTGVYGAPGPKELKGVKWSFRTGGSIVSSPAVHDGTVYVGSYDNFLYAIDQQTGKEKWKYKTRGPVTSSPAISSGLIFFSSYDGSFYALDSGGKLKWQFLIEGTERRFEAKGIHGDRPKQQTTPDAWDFFMSSPAIHNGKVYFGSSNGNIYSLKLETGELVWKFPTGGVVHASPAISDNTLFIGSWDSYFYAIDAETGQEKWKYKTGEDVVNYNQVGFQSSACIFNGVVYFGCRDSHVYALDAATGKKKWDYYTNNTWVTGTPAVSNGTVYAAADNAFALDAKTGRLRFAFEKTGWSASSIIICGDLVYAGQFTGRLFALDLKSGKVVWEFKTEGAKADPHKMLNAEGNWSEDAFKPFFFDFQDDYMFMFKRFSVGSIISTPVIDKEVLYFGSTDGFVYALY